MSLETILLEQAFKPLVGPLAPYDSVFWDVEIEPDFGLTSRTKMLALPAISLATLQVLAAPAKAWRPDTRGIVTEASLRLAIWKDRGRNLSAYDMALNFQYLYFRGDGNRGGKVPLLGLDLLRCIDELSCEAMELWVSVPTAADAYDFEKLRLKTAIARFERSLPMPSKPLTKGDQRRRGPIR
jgi:hypothetical protein